MNPDFLDRTASPQELATTGSVDPRVRYVRACSLLSVGAFIVFWQVRSIGGVSLPAVALTVGLLLACHAGGASLAKAASALTGPTPGIAFELLLGFFSCNTLLFILTLVTPFGMPVNVGLVGAVVVGSVLFLRSRPLLLQCDLRSECASLVCVVFCGIVATLWVGDQQPVITSIGDRSVFSVWSDVFIHVREISAFAQAHGLSSIADIKLAGITAPVYHFASYMVPAAFNALTGMSALDAFVSFQLPFGILLVGLAAFVLVAMTLRTLWPAVVAAICVLALPDAYTQMTGIRYLSFHFMSQVNLGMLYGIACAVLSWVFMIAACRRRRVIGLGVAYAFLAILVTYKAHLFVANALVLMLYPCAFYNRGGVRVLARWRLAAGLALVALFVVVVLISQQLPRVPTMRLDGSGIGRYVDLLMGGFHEGLPKRVFHWLYYEHRYPRVVQAALAASLILIASFGAWLLVAPLALWRMRRSIDRETLAFVVLVFVNYLAMSMGLALDERGIGAPEEFVNRPHAWAWFVVVIFGAAASGMWVHERLQGRLVPSRWWALPAAILLLLGVHAQASRLETFPEWDSHAEYADFNAAPTCLVQAAQYIRDHARIGDLLQDAELDPTLVVTALAERQGYVASGTFGGRSAEVHTRSDALASVQSSGDADALAAWARAHTVAWYVAHPDTSGPESHFGERVAYRCGGFSVVRFKR